MSETLNREIKEYYTHRATLQWIPLGTIVIFTAAYVLLLQWI